LFGFEKSERLDVDCILQRLHSKDREAVSKAFTKALAGEGSYETEYRVMLPDGRMRWIASRGSVELLGEVSVVQGQLSLPIISKTA